MRASFDSKSATTFLRQPGYRTDVHPSRPLALRPGLSTGLPLSRMKRPGWPFASAIADRNDVKSGPCRPTLYHDPKAVFPLGHLWDRPRSSKPTSAGRLVNSATLIFSAPVIRMPKTACLSGITRDRPPITRLGLRTAIFLSVRIHPGARGGEVGLRDQRSALINARRRASNNAQSPPKIEVKSATRWAAT
jgi:hypothetical protein